MTTRRSVSALSAVLLAALVVGAGAADAAPKKKKYVPTTSKFYFRANGCGATQEEGRLEPKSGIDDSSGCGIIGGLPLEEALYQLDSADTMDFRTNKKGMPIILDAGRKITGTFTTQSWISNGTGGAGKVDVDLVASGTTTSGKVISFGETKVTADASPTSEVTKVNFQFTVPAAAAKQAFKSLLVSVTTHGANFNMSAQHYDGDAFIVYPSFMLK